MGRKNNQCCSIRMGLILNLRSTQLARFTEANAERYSFSLCAEICLFMQLRQRWNPSPGEALDYTASFNASISHGKLWPELLKRCTESVPPFAPCHDPRQSYLFLLHWLGRSIKGEVVTTAFPCWKPPYGTLSCLEDWTRSTARMTVRMS